MEDRPFKENTPKPTPGSLKKALKATYRSYIALMEQTGKFQKEWNFSKSSGWVQKVKDSKKALFYFIPLQGSYQISLTVREKEREQLLLDDTLKSIHEMLVTAKKYPEGYALYFQVQNHDDAAGCNEFIRKLIALR